MLDHITIRVGDIDTATIFYSAVLNPLGYDLTFDQNFDGIRVIGFGKNGKMDTWFTDDKPVSGPVHIAWRANSKEEVDGFYKAALAAGGKDNGAPSFRPEYHENYYAAFVLDPDGNNLEAVLRD